MKTICLHKIFKKPITYILLAFIVSLVIVLILFFPRKLPLKMRRNTIQEVSFVYNLYDEVNEYPIKLNKEYFDDFTKILNKTFFIKRYVKYKTYNSYIVKIVYENGDIIEFGNHHIWINNKLINISYNSFDIHTFASWVGISFGLDKEYLT